MDLTKIFPILPVPDQFLTGHCSAHSSFFNGCEDCLKSDFLLAIIDNVEDSEDVG
jgi:hypothetical protein